MSDFFIGLGLAVLGFGFFQFSSMFGVYRAQKEETDLPWLYWFFRGVAYFLMAVGSYFMIKTLAG